MQLRIFFLLQKRNILHLAWPKFLNSHENTLVVIYMLIFRRHGTQHNDIQHNDTQHNGTQHNNK